MLALPETFTTSPLAVVIAAPAAEFPFVAVRLMASAETAWLNVTFSTPVLLNDRIRLSDVDPSNVTDWEVAGPVSCNLMLAGTAPASN